MKLTKEVKEMLKTAFAHHPKVNVFFVTSDAQAFDEASRADSHAQRLSDENVLTVTREGFEAGEALETNRAQAAHVPVNAVDTIPMEVINLDKSGTNDAGSALETERKAVKAEIEAGKEEVPEKTAEEIAYAEKAIDAQKSEVKTTEEITAKAKVAETSDAEAAEFNTLVSDYTELFGKKPHNKWGAVKIKTLIAEKKAEQV
jgi:hypothetical protein